MKKMWPCIFLLIGNEIVTYIILTAFLIMFFAAVIKQSEGRV